MKDDHATNDSTPSKQELEEMFEKPPKDLDGKARKVLLELLKICDKHGISKEGLIAEFQEGVKEDYICSVGLETMDVKDLDLERMAMIGEKRKALQQLDDSDIDGIEEWPRKIVAAETRGV